jgi:methylenetetrahydrofolate dehydrogenase (NADP+) / methenyltetrahydrofolate cyclohydrolase
MTAVRLDGKGLSQTIRQELSEKVKGLKHPPGLAVVLIGDNGASVAYVRNKQKACAEVGINSTLHHLPSSTTEHELLELLAKLNAEPTIHGILVQLPLPKQIREEVIISAVDPRKDVDCFHPENLGKLLAGQPRFYPCTPHGVVELLRRNGHDPAGKQVVIVGRSNIVGKPLAVMLMQKPSPENPAGGDATVTVAHTKTTNLAEVCRSADILIAAVGRAKLITTNMVKPGAIVIDVGTNPGTDGKLVGDVDPDVTTVAGALSPVPGGVGPMTITMLLANTLHAAEAIDG